MLMTFVGKQLTVHLLGRAQFALDERPFEFSARPKTLPLLCYLLLQRDRPLSRAALAFALWPDDEEEKARANLRRHLRYLAQALPPGSKPWVLASGETVRWNQSAGLWLDVAEFERLIACGDPAAAVELYRGDLLDGSYDECLFGARDRLRNAYLAALTELVLARRAARDFSSASEYARRLLQADPWREDIVRQLMAVRYASGDGAGALAEFDRFADSLRADMNVEPMPETIALREAVIRNAAVAARDDAATTQDDAATTPNQGTPAEGRAAHAQAKTTAVLPFVGRGSELEQLRAAWSRAARGHGSALLVSGEAGIGKTRLVSQLALQVEVEGGRVVWGATSSPESAAYQPIAHALRNALPMIAAAALRPLTLALVAQIVPELRSRLPDLPALQATEPERERTRLFDAIATTFEALATPRPFVVVLEDLHWAEAATVAALEFLIARVAQRSILLIGTYRDEEVGRVHALRQLRRRLQPERSLTHVAVPRLGREAVRELIATCAKSEGRRPEAESEVRQPHAESEVRRSQAETEVRLPEADLDSVFAISEGNPLFVGEAIRNLAEGRPLDATPATLDAFIGARFERLSASARELAGIAATIGEAFDVDVLRETSTWSESAVLEALDELQDRAIVREPVGRQRFDYAFTHNLVQRAVYASSSAQVQKRRHRRIARVMEDLFSSRLDAVAAEIARHYEYGGDPARAAERYVQAARAATAVFANDEALSLARAAARLCGDDTDLLFDALAIAESMNDRLGNREAQRADLARLESLARASGDRMRLCEILRRAIPFHRATGDRDAERAAINELKAEAQTARDPRWLGEAFKAEAEHLNSVSKEEASLRAARSAVEQFDAAGSVAELLTALGLQASIAAELGEIAEADASITRARDITRASPDAVLALRILRFEAKVCRRSSGVAAHKRMGDLGRECFALARSIGDREAEAFALSMIASGEANWGRRRAIMTESMALYEAIGEIQELVFLCLWTGTFEMFLGRWERALALFERLDRLAERYRFPYDLVWAYLYRSELFSYQEDFLEARAWAEKSQSLLRRVEGEFEPDYTRAWSLSLRGRALIGLGHAAGATRDLSEACWMFERGIGRLAGDRWALPGIQAQLAQAYWLIGDRDEARKLVLEALRAAPSRETATLFEPSWTWWPIALVLHWLGEHDAPEVLRQCYQLLAQWRDRFDNNDDDGRLAFMRMPVHERIVAAYERGEWPAPNITSRAVRQRGTRDISAARNQKHATVRGEIHAAFGANDRLEIP